jgi:hypothetical protein
MQNRADWRVLTAWHLAGGVAAALLGKACATNSLNYICPLELARALAADGRPADGLQVSPGRHCHLGRT